MPSIVRVEEATAPPKPSQERREFPSPDGKWLAAFHDPEELHMGLYGWSLSLIRTDGGADHTSTLPKELSTRRSFHAPDAQPWRFDSRMLALRPLDGALWLYDLVSARRTACEVTGQPLSAGWSPTQPRLLASYRDHLRLLDGDGKLVADAPWKTYSYENPFTAWTGDGASFFAIGRPSKSAKPRITLYRAEDASKVETLSLDPGELAPYEAEKYSQLKRNRYSLVVSESTRSVGALLDTWDEIHFDPQQNRLVMSIYRPTGEPYDLDGELVCKAHRKWLAVYLVL